MREASVRAREVQGAVNQADDKSTDMNVAFEKRYTEDHEWIETSEDLSSGMEYTNVDLHTNSTDHYTI